MAIVGSAEVIIRAIGDKLESDIQNALNKAAKGAKVSGNDAGENWSEGFNKSVNKNVDVSSINKKIEKGITKDSEKTGKKVANDVAKGIKDGTPQLETASGNAGRKAGDSLVRGINKGFRRRGIASIAAKIGLLVPIIGILGGAISSLVSGLFAMIAVMGSATQASASLLGGVAALAQGALVSVIAFKGVTKAIAAGMDPTKAKQFQKEMSKLPKPAKDFVKEFLKFKPVFKDIRKEMSSGLFEQLSIAIRRLSPLFTLIKKEAKGMGTAVGAAFSTIIREVTTPTALASLGNVIKSNNGVIRDFGFGVGGLAKGLIALLDAARPLTEGLSQAFAVFGQNIGAQLEASNASGTLTANLIVANNAFQTIWRSVKNLSAGLFEMGKIAKPAGLALFEAFEGATARFRNFASNPANADGLNQFFEDTKDNTLAISRLFAELGKSFLRLGANRGIADTANALTAIVPSLEEAFSASVSIGPALAELIGEFARLITVLEKSGALTSIIEIFATLADAVTTVLEAAGPLTPILIKLFAAFKLFQLFSRGTAPLAGFVNGLTGATVAAKKATGATANLTRQGTALRSVFVGGGVTGAFTGMAKGLGQVARTAGPMALAMSGVGESVGLSNTVMGAAIGSIFPGFGTAIGAAAGFVLDFAKNTDAASFSMGSLNSAIQRQDVTALTGQLDSYNARIKELWDLHRQSGIGDTISDFFKGFSSVQNFKAQVVPGEWFKQLEDLQGKSDKAKKAIEELARTQVSPNISIDVARQSEELQATIDKIKELGQQSGKPVTFNPLDGPGSREALQAAQDLGQAFQNASKALGQGNEVTQQAKKNFAQLAQSIGASPAALSIVEQRLNGVAAAEIAIPPGVKIDLTSTGDQLLLNTLGITQTQIDAIKKNSKVPVQFQGLIDSSLPSAVDAVNTAVQTATTANPTVTVGAQAGDVSAPLNAIVTQAAATTAEVPVAPKVKGGGDLSALLLNGLSGPPTVPVETKFVQPKSTSIKPPKPVTVSTKLSQPKPITIKKPKDVKITVTPPKPITPVIKKPKDVKVKVTDGGTVAAVQRKISNIKGGEVEVHAHAILHKHYSGGGEVTQRVDAYKNAVTGAIRYSYAATGGFVRGAGTATSDSIPAMLSNGEFVVNAAQTSKYLSLLQAINSGRTPQGQVVGSSTSISSSSVGGPQQVIGTLHVTHDKAYLTGYIQDVSADSISFHNSRKPSDIRE